METNSEELLRQVNEANNRVIDEVTRDILANPGENEERSGCARFVSVPEYSGLRVERHYDVLYIPEK